MNRPETIEETAALVDRAGGRGIAVRVDHLVPDEVSALVTRIISAQSNTAVASISIRKSGTAKAETPIQVLAGGFSAEKNSLRALPTAVALSA